MGKLYSGTPGTVVAHIKNGMELSEVLNFISTTFELAKYTEPDIYNMN